MATLRDIRRLLAFDDWANTQVVRALAPLESEVPAAVAWMAHVMAAKRLWFARVALTTAPFTVNPDLTLPAVVEQLREAGAEWTHHLDGLSDGDLDRVVHYANRRASRSRAPRRHPHPPGDRRPAPSRPVPRRPAGGGGDAADHRLHPRHAYGSGVVVAGRLRAVVALLAAAAAMAAPPAGAQPRVDARLVEALGWYTGVAGRVDDPKARALIDQAAGDGDVLARMWVARAYSRGRLGYPRDEVKARSIASLLVDAVRRQAGQGAIEAVFLMGTACDEGLGIDEDARAAFAWFQKAAAEGHTLAEHNLGNALAAGRGVAADPAAAVAWWLKAALKGDAVTALRLGEAYEQGRGVAADRTEATRWYTVAAARGNAAATAALQRLRAPAPAAVEPRPR